MALHLHLTIFSYTKWVESPPDGRKNNFLILRLEYNVFMSQLEGFVVKGKEQKVYNLVKSLYGLKQASCNLVKQAS